MKNQRVWVGSIVVAAGLTACAFDVVRVTQIPAAIETKAATSSGFTLDAAVTVDLGTGFRRTLRQGTRWKYVGTVPAGDVFRTNDQVLTVEASNIHEAYLVVEGNKLRGFYLPVEKSFSPLGNSVELRTSELRDN